MSWKLAARTMSVHLIQYQSRLVEKLRVGSNTTPRLALVDFSAFRFGLPANTPEMFWIVSVCGSFTWTKKVAVEGEISGSVGARKPLPTLPRSATMSFGVYFRPNFGTVELP